MILYVTGSGLCIMALPSVMSTRCATAKVHTCFHTLMAAKEILPTADPQGRSGKGPKPFVFAGPDEFKYDETVDIYTKYKMYISSKPWVKDNYLRIPDRKPDWIS